MTVATPPPSLSDREVLGSATAPRPAERTVAMTVWRAGAFAALAITGVVRWGTVLAPAPTGRLFGLVAIAVTLVACGPWLSARSRWLVLALGVVAAVGMLAVSGLPFAWIRHVRIAVSANAIGNGLTALPQLLVPYHGSDAQARMVIVMGAAVLLFAAALPLMAPWEELPGIAGDLRRGVAALPLVVLVAVPLALVPARLPYVEGLLVFVLLVALVWGGRLPRGREGGALLVCAAAAIAGMVLGPALHRPKPWINPQTLASGLPVAASESFDWRQSYRRLTWPQDGHEVLDVTATRPAYWKAVDLDEVGVGGWSRGVASQAPLGAGVSAASLRRWTQKLTVTIAAMQTSTVIGAGEFDAPLDAGQPVAQAGVPGSYVTARPLRQGDTYQVIAYTPTPSRAQLAAAGTHYPAAMLPGELSVALAVTGAGAPQTTVFFPAFGDANGQLSSVGPEPAGAELAASPYAPVYALAQRLRRGTATPYAYAERVQAYLARGYRYDLTPPASRYPLINFLLHSHEGYCQQFAGAMALLLRMGGVPARVAAGFTTGQRESGTDRYIVSDVDAHAWVEAFFPGYGWVTLDPTPASDPALQRTAGPSVLPIESADTSHRSLGHGLTTPGSQVKAKTTSPVGISSGGGRASGVAIAGLALLGALVVAAVATLVPRRVPSADALVAELERAFARSGRPLAPGLTLSELERHVSGSDRAREYIRILARARFGDEPAAVTSAQRSAVRGYLRAGLGLSGALRALWALPPRRWRR